MFVLDLGYWLILFLGFKSFFKIEYDLEEILNFYYMYKKIYFKESYIFSFWIKFWKDDIVYLGI